MNITFEFLTWHLIDAPTQSFCMSSLEGWRNFISNILQYFIIHLQEAVSLTNNKKFFLRIVRVLRLLHILTIVNFLIRIDPTKIFIEFLSYWLLLPNYYFLSSPVR